MPADTIPAETVRASAASTTAELPGRRLTTPAVFGQGLTRGIALGAVALLVLASLWLRVRTIHDHYWIDEGLSVGIASHPLSAIPGLMRQDGSPPLYYLLLHLWISWRGASEIATHELSLIFALLTIPAAYWAGSSLFDRRTGLICALLAAGASYLTQYGQETRMYTLLALVALIAVASFLHAFAFRRRRYIPVFVASLTAALYTHNWALFLGLMTAVAFLVCVRERPLERRELWRDGALAFGGVAVLYAPWIPTVLYQARHTGAPWDLPPVIWSLTQGLYSLVGGRGAAVALLLAGGSGLFALQQRGLLRLRGGESKPLGLTVACLILLAFGTLLIAWAYSKTTPAWANRYLAVIVGPLILLFGLGLARAGRLGLVALVLTCCFWVLDPLPKSRDWKSNVASVAARLRPHLGSDTLVLSTQPEQVPVIAYYLPGVSRFGTPLGPVADPRVVDWRDALGRLRRSSVRSVLVPMLRSLAPGQRVLLVVPAQQQKEPLWAKLIARYTTQWQSALAHDRSLKQVAVTSSKRFAVVSPDSHGSGLPVSATLYVHR